MAKMQMEKTTRAIELDFSEQELNLEVNAGEGFEIEYGDYDQIVANVEGDKTIIRAVTQRDEVGMSITVPESTNISIKCLNGDLTFEHPMTGDIAVICTNDLEFACDEAGSVAIKSEVGSIEINSAREIAIKTQNADVTIGDCTESCTIDAVSADIDVDSAKILSIESVQSDCEIGTAETISIQNLAGDINIDEAGDLEIETTSGDIEIGSVDGKVKIRSTSSDIEIGEMTTCNAVIDDVSGSICIDMLKVVSGEMTIKTVSDDIHVGVHPETSAVFILKSATGDITTPNDDESDVCTYGAGVAKVFISTVSGSIEIE